MPCCAKAWGSSIDNASLKGCTVRRSMRRAEYKVVKR